MEIQDRLSVADSAEFVLTGRPLKLAYRSLLSSFVTDAGCPGEIPLFEIVHMLVREREYWSWEEESWRINIEVVPKKKQAESTSSLAASNAGRESLQVLLDATIKNFNLVHEYEVEAGAGFHERVQGLPTRHILLREGEIGKPWVQDFVKRHVCTLGLPWQDAVQHLPTLLASHHHLPASTPLRHFLFYARERKELNIISSYELQQIVKALKLLVNIGVGFYNVHFADDHDFTPTEHHLFDASTYLALCYNHYSRYRNVWSLCGHVSSEKQLLLARVELPDKAAGILGNPSCDFITRLDLRESFHSTTFVRALAGAMSLMTDLGLRIDTKEKMWAFLDSRVHTRLLTLRVLLYDAQSWWEMLVVQGLADSSCTVQLLDVQFKFIDNYVCGWLDVWPPLVQSNAAVTLKALRIDLQCSIFQCSSASLTEYLSCCSLVFLEVISEFTTIDNEWERANSLVNNFCLLSLGMPWQNEAAEGQAASFIRRNNIYAAGQLFKEPQVKPNTAKLFLCGHGEVGKTTLCRSLHRVSKNPWSLTTSLVCTRAPKRTRGMEFHSLGIRGTNKKLLICDLAGQEEFHVFHHYFMKANNNDLFIVVCKVDSSSSRQEFQCQLDYWLRFIVSHRSTRNNVSLAMSIDTNHADIKPKVIVVVNFFNQDETSDAMRNITAKWSEDVIQRFSAVLNFGGGVASQGPIQGQNLFGLNARTGHGVPPLKSALHSLFEDFMITAWPIPRLCYDISTRLIKRDHSKWLCPGIFATRQKESRLFKSYSAVLNMISDSKIEPIKVQAALEELHNQGFVVFFPQDEMKTYGTQGNDPDQSTLVITDTSWFCNKLVGSLLGTHLKDEPRRSCEWVWDIEDIKTMLRRHGCEEMHLEEILRYLQRLELCTSLDIEQGEPKGHLLFPALVKQRVIQFPVVSNANDAMDTRFFGRRLRCKDSSIHLIPFGVFTRLQVKLHKKYAASNDTFQLGYGWVSFMKGNVGVAVRFGGDTIHEAWESKQWVDILIFCPIGSRHTASSSASKIISVSMEGHRNKPMDNPTFLSGNTLMDEIVNLMKACCKLNEFGGIPSVMLEECVLQCKEPHSRVVPLSSVLAKVRTQGLLESFQEWVIDIPSTPVMNLLLPKEIENCVQGFLNVLVVIEEEFVLKFPGDGESSEKQEFQSYDGDGAECSFKAQALREIDQKQEITEIARNHVVRRVHIGGEDQEHVYVKDESSSASGKQLANDQFQALLLAEVRRLGSENRRNTSEVKRCIKSEVGDLERRLDSRLKMIREDIRNLGDVWRQAERDIIANCSTRLLIHELRKDRAYPIYPYLVDATGKLAPLRALFRKRAVVHFMCESPTEGPHPVERQKGKEVTIKAKQWVAKIARVMVPAVKIICCLARLAAAIYLPSAQVFIPTPEALVSGLGIEGDALQHIILPKALEALLDDMDLGSKLAQLRLGCTDVLQQQEVKEAMEVLLQNVEVDMASDFGLHRVYFDDVDGHTFWVCDRHVQDAKRLHRISNPFRSS